MFLWLICLLAWCRVFPLLDWCGGSSPGRCSVSEVPSAVRFPGMWCPISTSIVTHRRSVYFLFNIFSLQNSMAIICSFLILCFVVLKPQSSTLLTPWKTLLGTFIQVEFFDRSKLQWNISQERIGQKFFCLTQGCRVHGSKFSYLFSIPNHCCNTKSSFKM